MIDTKYLRYISKVIAGERGLSKNVSWVHVLEIRDIIKECVNGRELILTTGIGFTDKAIALRFLEELIDQGVSALCIETALYYHEVDRELIELANEKGFPLIEITEISRFVDITKGLNTLLINEDSKFFQDADLYDNQLNAINSKGTIADGIRYTAEYLNAEVAYLPLKGKQFGASEELKKFIDSRLEILNKNLADDEIFTIGSIAIKHLKIIEKNWGYLIFKSSERAISQFELLILNRLSNKLKNDIVTELLGREEKLYKDNGWLKQWLNGNLGEPAIREKIREAGLAGNFKELFVCCTNTCCTSMAEADDQHEMNAASKFDERISFDDFLLHTTVIVKRVLNDEGFSVLGYMENGIISYIVLIPDTIENVWESVEKAIEHLRQYKNQFADYRNSGFFIGKKIGKLTDLKKSYDTAIETLAANDDKCGKTIIFDKLFISRIIRPLKDLYVLDEFVKDHLGGLLDPVNTELLHTLKVYYECNCSKQKTAEKLFVVRQTLYFRLEKIQDILGDGFDDCDRRFALEFAIHAYFYDMNIR